MTARPISRAGVAVVLAFVLGAAAASAQVTTPSSTGRPATPPPGTWTADVAPGASTPSTVPQPPGDAPTNRPATAEDVRLRRIQAARLWAYQLRLIDPNQIRQSPFDLVVIDHAISAFRRFVREFTPDEIATLRQRADGSTRVALAYLSIGEAERYRFYWNQDWYEPSKKPAWLGDVNPQWDGNYTVKFWDPGWQRLLFGGPEAYVERIIAQGFDGLYLDRADIFLEFAKSVPDAEARMVEFLTRLIAHARRLKPDILIVMQNAEELLRHAAVRTGIDALAKEDLYYGIDHREGRNSADTVEWTVKELQQMKRAGRPVFVVEYLSDPAKTADAERRAARQGFRLHVTARDLGQLTLEPQRLP